MRRTVRFAGCVKSFPKNFLAKSGAFLYSTNSKVRREVATKVAWHPACYTSAAREFYTLGRTAFPHVFDVGFPEQFDGLRQVADGRVELDKIFRV